MILNKKLLVLTAKPSINEEIIDWLISHPIETGFTSFDVSGHGSQMTNLSIAEQVSGRQKKTRFQIMVEDQELESFVQSLKLEFKQSGIHYWVQPIIEEGEI